MRLTSLLVSAALAGVATASFVAVPAADAQYYRSRVVYSEPQGPRFDGRRARTRITVQPRSFLDLGTETMPGDYKYADYAMPPNYTSAPLHARAGFGRYTLPGPFTLPSKRNPAQW